MTSPIEPTCVRISRSVARLKLIQRQVGELSNLAGLSKVYQLLEEARQTLEKAQNHERDWYLANQSTVHAAPNQPFEKYKSKEQYAQVSKAQGGSTSRSDRNLREIAWELELLNHDLYRDD
jgi:hypothetical protein